MWMWVWSKERTLGLHYLQSWTFVSCLLYSSSPLPPSLLPSLPPSLPPTQGAGVLHPSVGQQGAISEAELPNDSSAEEEEEGAGEDEGTIVENLSQQLDTSSFELPTNEDGEEGNGGGKGEGEAKEPLLSDVGTRFSDLRKHLLTALMDYLEEVEAAGGMRAIGFMQVRR